MNLIETIQSAGFSCEESGKNSLRLIAPFTFGNDGDCVSFYVSQPTPETFSITDAGEILFHASSLGMEINQKRIIALNNTYSVDLAQIDAEGCIVSRGEKSLLVEAIWDTIKLIMAIIFRREDWQKKFREERFRSLVFAELGAQIGVERLIRRIKVKASSGHDVEFPIGIKRGSGADIYVTTVSSENGGFDWGSVYQTHGRFYDVKAISDIDNRLTILQDYENHEELSRVQNYLLDTSFVYVYQDNTDWKAVIESI